MSSEVMARLKKDYIYNLMLKGEREDKRSFDEVRDIQIETNVIDKAEGSAKVQVGQTQLIAGIKLQKGTPFPDSPDEGVIITSMELNPIASPIFEPGPPNENAVEMSRVVDRGIRESGSIDLKKLCIKEGEEVWMVFVDIHVLNDDGNILDAASIGAISALLTTKIPAIGEDNDEIPVPVRELPVAISLVDIEGQLMVDPSLDEETICNTKITIISNQDGSICGMQKSGNGGLTIDQVLEASEIAVKRASEIREKHLLDI
ncbi:exosome complex component RRP42 [Methanosalsum natronophilum]|nr:exosome complex component RRP42 [Methanosalsum natronophilum]